MRLLGVIHQQASRDDARVDGRRPTDLTASLAAPGAAGVGCLVLNLSASGFMARPYAPVAEGSAIWLRVPGFPAIAAQVVWTDDGQIGCAFERLLDARTLARLVADGPQLH